MTGYTKLSSALVTSTVWRESSDTRVVWITLLALANAHGEVMGSVPGLAHIAGVSVDACREALDRFRAPDPDSRTQDYEGRRIWDIDGGWFIINYGKHRDLLSVEHRRTLGRDRAKRHRDKKRDVTPSNADVTQSNDKQYAEANAKGSKALPAGFIKNPNGTGLIRVAD